MTFKELIDGEREKEYFKKLKMFVHEEYLHYTCYPPKENIFASLRFNDIPDVKVVILGQDPYHEPNQAHGLAFSVLDGNPLPKSLINIYEELYNDVGVRRTSGNLTDWAKQGVLLLNTVLSVREHLAGSHRNQGYEILTDKIIEELNKDDHPKVFILWGKDAISKRSLITSKKHLILSSPHPSPLSAYRGFFGSKPFSKTNDFLIKNGIEPIKW